jgi:OOP family OmpA-OmpF porin
MLRRVVLVIGCVLVGPPGSAFSQEATAPAPVTPSFDIENNRLALPAPVTFETGGAGLVAGPQPALAHIAAFLAAKSYVSLLRIEGHVDADTAADKAQALTEARAMAAVRWLLTQGVDCKRVLPVGFGASKPVAPNDTPENKAQNRRVEAHVAELRGRAIGGMPVDGGGRVAGDPCKP